MKKVLKKLNLDCLDIALSFCVVTVAILAISNAVQKPDALIGPLVSLMSVLIALRVLMETRKARTVDRMFRRPFMVVGNDGVKFENQEAWKIRFSIKYSNVGVDPAEDVSNFLVILDEAAEIVDRGTGNVSVNPLASGCEQVFAGQPIDFSANAYGTYFIVFVLRYRDIYLKLHFPQVFMYKWVRGVDTSVFNPCSPAERDVIRRKWYNFDNL